MVASKTNKNWNRSYSRAHAVPSPIFATAAAYLMDNVHAERNSVDKWSFCLGRQISDRDYFSSCVDVEVAVVYHLVLPRVILHVCIYDACMYV